MPAIPLRAQLSDQELLRRQHARLAARRTLPNPAAMTRALALAICEVEAGLRSASQLERICHPRLWGAVPNRIQRAGGPPASGSSVLRVQVQELTPGLVDAVAVVRRGRRAVFIALRLGPVSKWGWLPSWGDCPVRVMIVEDQGCDLRSGRLVRTAGAGVVQGGRAAARVSALVRGFLPVRGRAVALR